MPAPPIPDPRPPPIPFSARSFNRRCTTKGNSLGRERELPPPLEMMCLNALWEIQEGNVEDVRKVVAQNRPLAYTTVLTLLDRLARRGAVSRRKEGRGFRYQPTVARDKLRRMALRQFLEYHFDGSEAKLKIFLEQPVEASTPERAIGRASRRAGRKLEAACFRDRGNLYARSKSKTGLKILVRATNWIGDAVMSLPALRAIRQRFPDAEITRSAPNPGSPPSIEGERSINHVMRSTARRSAATGGDRDLSAACARAFRSRRFCSPIRSKARLSCGWRA